MSGAHCGPAKHCAIVLLSMCLQLHSRSLLRPCAALIRLHVRPCAAFPAAASHRVAANDRSPSICLPAQPCQAAPPGACWRCALCLHVRSKCTHDASSVLLAQTTFLATNSTLPARHTLCCLLLAANQAAPCDAIGAFAQCLRANAASVAVDPPPRMRPLPPQQYWCDRFGRLTTVLMPQQITSSCCWRCPAKLVPPT
jgi:hypothetical protein